MTRKQSHQMSFHLLRLGGWMPLAPGDTTNSSWLYCSLGASHLLITGNRAIKKKVFKVIYMLGLGGIPVCSC